jgi:hypothetical protein
VRLKWNCDICRKAIGDGGGYVLADRAHANQRLRAIAELPRHEGVVSLAELVDERRDIPPLSRWHAYHNDCDPRPNAEDEYVIDVHRIRTLAELVQWNAHLSEKTWIGETDWYRFIQRRFGPYARPSAQPRAA